MNKKKSFPVVSSDANERKRLVELREALLKLHKTLVDSERVGYEQTVGKIKSPNHFLQLLINDPWFAWLQPLSQLIVSMDEALHEKQQFTASSVMALVKEAGLLLQPNEHAQQYSGHYFAALQRDPDVVLAHGEAVKLLGPRTSQAK